MAALMQHMNSSIIVLDVCLMSLFAGWIKTVTRKERDSNTTEQEAWILCQIQKIASKNNQIGQLLEALIY